MYRYDTNTGFNQWSMNQSYIKSPSSTQNHRIYPNPIWRMQDNSKSFDSNKPHRCDWWGKYFSQKGNLKKHVRQHINPDVNDRKRFSWTLWGKGYTERYNFKVCDINAQVYILFFRGIRSYKKFSLKYLLCKVRWLLAFLDADKDILSN